MPSFSSYQISSLGSKDPKNQKIAEMFKMPVGNKMLMLDPAQQPGMEVPAQSGPSASLLDAAANAAASGQSAQTLIHTFKPGEKIPWAAEWENSPNNPIIQGFQGLFDNGGEDFDDPETQNFLFDVDNSVKGTAGIFRENQQGLSSFGVDIDGKPLYGFDEMRNSNEFDLGKNRLFNVGSIIQQLGVFRDEEDSDRFAAITELSGDPNFMGRIEGFQNQGDTKGAVNTILAGLGQPQLDALRDSDDPKRSSGLAFAAYNYVQNAEKMSPSQKSMALSTMGLMAYKFKDGSTLAKKPVISNPDGSTAMSVGEAMRLAGSGVDVFSMQKNWDQLTAIQLIQGGEVTPSQLAATGQMFGLLGDPSMGGASVKQTAAQLAESGFVSVPSAGIGAITGSGDALPDGYEVIGAGEAPGQVIAVPSGLSNSAATINGTNEIRSINAAPGVRKASTGAFKVANNWLPTGTQTMNSRGTAFASGMGQSSMAKNPYLMSALAVASAFGNTVNKSYPMLGDPGFNDWPTAGNPQGQQQSQAAAKAPAKINVANAAKAGAVISGALGSFGGGAGVLLSTGNVIAAGAAIPAGATAVGSAALPATGVLGALGPVGVGLLVGGALLAGTGILDKLGGGKSEEQLARDAGRNIVKDLTNGDWAIPLSDGSFADIGTDGKGGLHEFRFPEKDPNKVGRKLYAYDVDYTNDLDFTSNMMSNAFMRLLAGGKGTAIDQVAGQVGNAALGKVGFGQDMTEENFSYVRDNIRGLYFKKGIQTKEDAYALMNQQLATGRLTEMDQIAMQQGINMVFDENGFDNANIIMAGRWKGIEVAGSMSKSPGPNFNLKPMERPVFNPDSEFYNVDPEMEIGESVDVEDLKNWQFQFDAGPYGGAGDTSAFMKSIIKYQEQAKGNLLRKA